MLSPRTGRRMRGEAGIVGANLVIVLAFALYAVIQLSRVTLAAQQIDDRVEVIIGEVGPIDTDLDEVAKLEETNRIAADILTAARPLSAQADQVLAATKSIDNIGSSLINVTAEINGSVKDIRGNLATLQPHVVDINNRVARINGQADVIIGQVQGIRADLNNVLAEVGGPGSRNVQGRQIAGHAQSINCNQLVNGGLLGGASGGCTG